MKFLRQIKQFINMLWSGKKCPYQVLTLLLIFFIIGIFIAKYLDLNWINSRPVFLWLILIILLANLINLILDNKQIVVLGWALIFIIFGLAVYSYSSQKYFCTIELNGSEEIRGKVINNPSMDYKGQQIIVAVDSYSCKNLRVLAKVPRLPILDYGDEILFNATLRKPGVINGFDYAKYLQPQKVSYIAENPGTISVIGVSKKAWERGITLLYTIKKNFESIINSTMSEPEASLAVGLITGSKSNLPQDLSDNINISGLTHIIALSGFNVTIIMAAIASALAGVLNRKKIFWIGSVLVIIFIVMTGASASVVRAGIFSLLVLYGKTLGRRAHQTNLMFSAGALMLLFNPFLLADDLGFQLSFLAFAGIIYLGAPVKYMIENTALKWLPGWLKAALAETLSAQILVFPLITFAFGRVSLISPMTNVAVLWILPLAMLLVFLAGTFGMASLYLGKILAQVTWPVLAYIISIANLGAKVPYSAIATDKYNLSATIIIYIIIITALAVSRRKVKLWQKSLQKSSS